MAKQGRVLPARRSRRPEPSVLLRSAESLGRVIGLLQRELDSVSKRSAKPETGNGHRPPGKPKSANGSPKPSARSKASAKTKPATAGQSTSKKTTSSRRRRKG